MSQEIITYILLGIAIVFLVNKFRPKKKKKGCDTDCGC